MYSKNRNCCTEIIVALRLATSMLICLGTSPLFADTIYLTNNETLTNVKIEKQNDKEIVVNINGGLIIFSRNEIAKIEKGEMFETPPVSLSETISEKLSSLKRMNFFS
ncbi:MAG: hypothetical protein KKH94_02150 [Candidatus Omnitrophica bacterium]|nr:hypothetical protein [Candidatus Omnitrophota bacterium]